MKKILILLCIFTTLITICFLFTGCPGFGDPHPANPTPTITPIDPVLCHASMNIQPYSVTVGQNITVQLIINNCGGTTAQNVTPTSGWPVESSMVGLIKISGPSPFSQDIPSGTKAYFSWVYGTNTSETVNFTCNASGINPNNSSIIESNIASGSVNIGP